MTHTTRKNFLKPAYTLAALALRGKGEILIYQERTATDYSLAVDARKATYGFPTVTFLLEGDGRNATLSDVLTIGRQRLQSAFAINADTAVYLGHQNHAHGRIDFVAIQFPQEKRPRIDLEHYKKYIWISLGKLPLTRMDTSYGAFFSREDVRKRFDVSGITKLGQKFLRGQIQTHADFASAHLSIGLTDDTDEIDHVQPSNISHESRPLHVLLDPQRR